jgi:hypothetical protein
MGSGLVDDVIWGLVSPVGMASEHSLVSELSVTQRALVDVWEVCLGMKGSQDQIIRPEGAIDTEVSAGKLWGLGHVFVSRIGWSVIVVDVYFKGDATDKTLGALGTLVVVWDVCVEES